MRISSTMMVGNYIKQLNRSAVNQAKLMEQADGERIHRPSDDPVAYSRMMMFKNNLSQNEQYTKNLGEAVSWMKSSDSTLVNMNDILSSIREKTLKADDTTSEKDKIAIANEIDSLIEQLVTLGNTQVGKSYLFSGQMDLTKPFEIAKTKIDKADLKTLDDAQKDLFGTDQMLVMTDGTEDGIYYMDPKSGNVYAKSYVDSGYKDVLNANQDLSLANKRLAVQNGNSGKLSPDGVTDYNTNDIFTSNGNSAPGAAIFKTTGELNRPADVYQTTGGIAGLQFQTSLKTVVIYNGDDHKISMPVQNGEATPRRDSVNVTGVDVFGTDIFGGKGASVLNDLYEISDRIRSGDKEWIGADGLQLADRSVDQVLNAETDLGARTAGYSGALEMMNKQNTVITEDITNASGTDVGLLSVELQKAQLVYNMSLALAAKILPPSLADYL